MRTSSFLVALSLSLTGIASGFRASMPCGYSGGKVQRHPSRAVPMASSLGRPFDELTTFSRIFGRDEDDEFFLDALDTPLFPSPSASPQQQQQQNRNQRTRARAPSPSNKPSQEDTWSTPVAPSVFPTFKVDISESEKEYTVKADLPGVRKGDMRVTIDPERRLLTIIAERKFERSEEKGGKGEGGEGKQDEEQRPLYKYTEIKYGKVYRAFKLPSDVDVTGDITANLNHGVLVIKLPKKPRTEAQDERGHRAIAIQ